MRVVDCGANLGYFTLLAARLVGPGGRVEAFEPDPENRARLERHLRNNDLAGRVTVHAAAVSDAAGSAALYHPVGDAQNHGEASLFADNVPGGRGIEVPLVRLDERIEGRVDLIKMDIEGAELAAVKGAEGLLRSEYPPALIIEHNVPAARAAGWRPGELFDYLARVQPRYRIHWIGWRLRPITAADELDRLPRQGNLWIAPAPAPG